MLTETDALAIAKAIAGRDWQTLQVSNGLRQLLGGITKDNGALMTMLLTSEVKAQIFAIDPDTQPPAPPPANQMPELPKDVRLTKAQVKAAASVGCFLDEFTAWAGGIANETPLLFLQAAGIFLGAIAIGRRAHVRAYWGKKIYPNIYAINIAISTYFRKGSAHNLADDIAWAAIPHMLLPNPGSPESFLNLLAGGTTANFEALSKDDQERILKGTLYAAQRGLIRDEISGMFKSMGKDYMAGMKELILELYDCPPMKEHYTNSKGLIIIRDMALSILGTSTPAELGNALSLSDWYNGNLARFALLTPEPDYKERPALFDHSPVDEFVKRLRTLNEKLPTPVRDELGGGRTSCESWSLVFKANKELMAYAQALRQLTSERSPLDDRLRSPYGRLHVQALKIAIIAAALDWADRGDFRTKPVVELEHWYKGQFIAEAWRASAHRLLDKLGETLERRIEDAVMRILSGSPQGLTARDIYRMLNLPRKPVAEALEALEEDGRVYRVSTDTKNGRKVELWMSPLMTL